MCTHCCTKGPMHTQHRVYLCIARSDDAQHHTAAEREREREPARAASKAGALCEIRALLMVIGPPYMIVGRYPETRSLYVVSLQFPRYASPLSRPSTFSHPARTFSTSFLSGSYIYVYGYVRRCCSSLKIALPGGFCSFLCAYTVVGAFWRARACVSLLA